MLNGLLSACNFQNKRALIAREELKENKIFNEKMTRVNVYMQIRADALYII